MENINLNKNHLKMGGALIAGLAIGFLCGSYYTQRTIEKQIAQNFMGTFLSETKAFDENFKGTQENMEKSQKNLDEVMNNLKQEFEEGLEKTRERIHGK